MKNLLEVAGLIQAKERRDGDLWPRFKKVRDTILSVFTGSLLNVQSRFSTFDWSGVDHGIHDLKGRVVGSANDIYLDLTVNGETVDNQIKIVPDPTRQWKLTSTTEHSGVIYGSFVSKDEVAGNVYINFGNTDPLVEGYWLRYLGGKKDWNRLLLRGKYMMRKPWMMVVAW